VEEGIVPGGGAALVHLAMMIPVRVCVIGLGFRVTCEVYSRCLTPRWSHLEYILGV
jgi:hypothetical protein